MLQVIRSSCWLVGAVSVVLTGHVLQAQSAPAPAPEVVVDIEVGEPVMMAGKGQKAYIKIGLTGFKLPAANRRAPINLALVLDRSSSMFGEKLTKAKQAAVMVIDRLNERDTLAIVTYDSTVEVLVPSTRVTNREALKARVLQIEARGSTALFAGVSYGIEEVRKFWSKQRVNRIVLLSDGQANIGPSSPNELRRLGVSAAKQGVSVTTIGLGLGYNEDLMTQLAMASDGNHGFAESAADLARLFNHELGDVLSVVAQDIEVEIELGKGIVPVRSLNRNVTIRGRKVSFDLNQVYAEQQKAVLLEVKVPAGKASSKREIAKLKVGYDNMLTKKRAVRRDRVAVSFSESAERVARSQNRDVMVASVEAVATLANARAVTLRDRGQVAAAEAELDNNSVFLEKQATKYKSKRLKNYARSNRRQAKTIKKPATWRRTRKSMKAEQYRNSTLQSW